VTPFRVQKSRFSGIEKFVFVFQPTTEAPSATTKDKNEGYYLLLRRRRHEVDVDFEDYADTEEQHLLAGYCTTILLHFNFAVANCYREKRSI